ncbi:hypothetical protein [Ferrovibrio sp.]|uniref:hypothetical protein n=1 Tax=Ferrovibrio sp. TaxID=1917215 RepID=UPI0025C1B115|nr:hypothetical protein [Ferrovibrio sp.]
MQALANPISLPDDIAGTCKTIACDRDRMSQWRKVVVREIKATEITLQDAIRYLVGMTACEQWMLAPQREALRAEIKRDIRTFRRRGRHPQQRTYRATDIDGSTLGIARSGIPDRLAASLRQSTILGVRNRIALGFLLSSGADGYDKGIARRLTPMLFQSDTELWIGRNDILYSDPTFTQAVARFDDAIRKSVGRLIGKESLETLRPACLRLFHQVPLS